MKHLWIYVVFIMALNFQRILASDVCFSNEQTCNCTSHPVQLREKPTFCVTCTVPALGANVSSSCSPGTSVSYKDLCSFFCPTGYSLAGSSSVNCTGSGNFSEPFPQCEVITCTVPSLDENVNSSCSPNTSVSYNERCNFSCPTNYSRAGPVSVTCTGLGSFSEPFPQCEECDSNDSVCPETVTCTVPALEENVSSSCTTDTSVSYNQQCYFSCPTGYNLIGPSSVTCTGSGSFSEPFPRCDEVTCTVPALGANVSSSCSPGTSVNYNDLCSFSCQTGFNLIGTSSVTCTGSGSFSEPFPRCEVITCTVPTLEEHVNASCSPNTSVSYNERCNFSCPTNYSRAGPPSVTCTGLGSFSEPFPHCEECDPNGSVCPETVITCTVPAFDELVSSCPTGEYVIYNHNCSFSCPTGYNLEGSSSVNCTGSGNFSEPFPQCEDIDDCAPQPCLNGGTCTDGVNSYSCSCDTGYSGMNCSIATCDPNPCSNGGTYTKDGVSSYTCTCAPDYTGTRCECCSNDSDCPETELGIIDVNFTSPGTSSGRRKRAAVPIESAVVQNLLDSIVIAVDRLPEVISVNRRAISANDDVIDFITARVRLDVTFGSDITIQQLTLLVIASINNFPGVDVQSFELLTDPCSLDNPCGNGDTCVRVEPGSANVTCTPDDDDDDDDDDDNDDDDGITPTLAIALPIAFLLLVAIGFLAFVYHRYGMKVRGRKGSVITPEPLVQEGTPGAGLQRSSSVGNLPSGNIKPPLAHEFNDGLEMDSRLNSDEVDRHDAEVKGLSYRQTVDEHRATSCDRAKESDLIEVPQKELRV